jgi:hypothetical protein
MLITDKTQNPNTTIFRNLEFGDVFQDESGDICMKMANEYFSVNAILLTTGVPFCCRKDETVTLLNAELTITNK